MASSILVNGLSLGAIEVGVLLSSLLYGMSLVQAYNYAINCTGDHAWLKAMVAAVCLFETLHTIAMWMYLYFLTVSQFGNTLVLLQLPSYFGLFVTFQAVAGTLVQAFYVWRVYLVSRKWWLTIIPATGAIVRTVAAILVTVYTIKLGYLPAFREDHGYLVYISTISSASADLWNTVALCWFLRSRSTVHSRNVINRIMIWVIETGLITSVAAILLFTFWTAMPNNGVWIAVLIIYGKLYSNSLLVSLNVRKNSASYFAPSQRISGSQSAPGAILITRTRDYDSDMSDTQKTLPVKPGNGSLLAVMPLADLNCKNRQLELPFETC